MQLSGGGVNPEERHLVFGDDGSAAADVAWLWINNHAWPQWRISVVTAQLPPLGPVVGSERSTPHAWTPAAPRQLLGATDATEVEHLTAEADPRIVLDSFPEAALMAIGPRGHGALKRLHLGSTAEWLVSAHRPLTPLVVVRSARPTRRVLLCVDGSPHARQAARALAGLPWVTGTRTTILGVIDHRHDVERGVEDAGALLEARGAEGASTVLREAVRQTATFDVRSTILDTIAGEDPDLVVMGTRGVGGIRRAVLGSTASAVLHHAPCSVLVARAREDAGDPDAPDREARDRAGQDRSRQERP